MEVPPELETCEFDCRETQCSSEEFEQCPRRNQRVDDLKKGSQENLG